MPFTPAHPAILLPAKVLPRKYISWTALIIGSMVPDMEYFLFMNPGSRISHTLYGVLNFNLPVTILLAMAWHQFVGPALLRAFPFAKNFYTTLHRDFADWFLKNWLVFIISALVGIGSHLFLDGFCHHRGFVVQRVPYLQEVVSIAGFSVRRCYLLWYLLSLIGLICMMWATIDFQKVFRKSNWMQFWNMRAFFIRCIVLTALIAVARILFGLKWNVVRHLVVIALGAGFYSVILVSMYDHYIRKKY